MHTTKAGCMSVPQPANEMAANRLLCIQTCVSQPCKQHLQQSKCQLTILQVIKRSFQFGNWASGFWWKFAEYGTIQRYQSGEDRVTTCLLSVTSFSKTKLAGRHRSWILIARSNRSRDARETTLHEATIECILTAEHLLTECRQLCEKG